MNILFLCDEYPPGRHGGIGTAVQMQAREMVRKGHKVIVAGFYDWGYGGADKEEDNGVLVYRFRRGLDSSWFHKKDAKRVRATYRLLKMTGLFQRDIERSLLKYRDFLEGLIEQYQVDLIEKPDFNEYMQYCTRVTHFPALSRLTVVKLHGTISYMLKERGIEPPGLLLQMEREVLHTADLVTSVSEYTARKTAGYFGYTRAIPVVYNGIETVRKTSYPKVAGQVVFTGSLVEKKGIFQLMKAWNIVAEKEPGARLLVLGKGHVEKVEVLLSAAARAAVEFKGHVSRQQLMQDLAGSQVAVFPSYAETFGMAAAEAMAAGTATIFSTRTSGPEVIRDEIDGLLADPDDVESIAGKILRILRDEELRTRLELSGRQRVEEQFEIGKVAERNSEIYQRLLGTR
ncbi:MAG: glycosyltransferase family 4 protein [Flavipsychrobacter sp.]|nr:glycosyltransferase family 4 protein [Flavipsychrobacter sp.]